MSKNHIRFIFGVLIFAMIFCTPEKEKAQLKYESTWTSLSKHQTPQWYKDAKFGIYTHWGIYSVPAKGPNGSWYEHFMYISGSEQNKYHIENYGPPEKFGYKDFIPMFKAEKFNADEWADLFQKSGAQFAGPVAIHHDGFAMWDTKYSEWNAAKMGPHKDVVGELERAIKKRGMKFLTSFHHIEHWWFVPTWDQRYDTNNPAYKEFYGPIHDSFRDSPTDEYLTSWKDKVIEVIDNYDPDIIWFDTGLGSVREDYRKQMIAYFYNKALERNKEVVLNYKGNDISPGIGVVDLELAQMRKMTYYNWITDTSVDDQGAWGYVKEANYKSVNNLVDNLIDRVSKNGYLLLNVGPKADGSIPEEVKEQLLGIGNWLKINGEAIYSTIPWTIAEEGPTKLKSDASFNNEEKFEYTSQDIRFTTKDNILYAICLDWPGEKIIIKSLSTFVHEDFVGIYKEEIKSVSMLGDGKELEWVMDKEGMIIKLPLEKPCNYAFVFKIVLSR